jgi:type II secretory pathway pseudopilin PulG
VICRKNSALLAFSLVEVMVAVGLLAVIIVGLLAMFYQTQRAFRAGMTQVDVLESGRATIELIARELQETAASIDNVVTNVQITKFPNYVPIPMELPGNGSVNLMIQNLSFLRRMNFHDPSGSDGWTGQSYQVSNAVAGVGTLYRLTVTNGIQDSTVVAEGIRNADVKTAPDFRPVADGIVHFRIWPQDSRGVTILKTNGSSIIAFNSIDPNNVFPDSYWFWSNALPSYYDIELAVLEPKSIEQFRSRYAIDPLKASDYLQRQAGRIHFFKRRVSVRSGPTYFAVTNVP